MGRLSCTYLHVRGHNYDVFLSLKVVLIVENSADPDEMQHYTAFHMGLHRLPKYSFRGLQYTNGKGKQSIFV